MTTTLQVRVDKNLKEEFLKASKEKWLDGSMLIRHFMASFTKQPEIVQFNIDEWFFDEIMSDKKITKKLKNISHKLDEIWF